MKVVVVIPTYNERENIIALLDALQAAGTATAGHQFLYLVVDDTSPDGTARAVAAYQKIHKQVHLLLGKKQGLGEALLRGLTFAVEHLHAEILVQIDADLSHDPAAIVTFMQAIDTGADFVVGSRYIKGGSIPDNWGLHRKIYSVIGNAIVRFGLGYLRVHDWTGGYRAYKRKFFEDAKDQMAAYSGYVFQIAFLHKAIKHHAHVVEVPIQFTDRRYGHSKIAASEYIRKVIVYVVSERLASIWTGSFGKFLVVGTIGFIINTLVLEWLVRVGLSPTVGSAVGAQLAIVSNFFLNNAWTFGQRRVTGIRILGKFFQFNLTSIGAVIIQSGTVFAGTLLFGQAVYRPFYLGGVGLGLLWNYWMYTHVVWKRHDRLSNP